MAHVFILSTYGEHGAENVVATLDRSKLEGLLVALCDEIYGTTHTGAVDGLRSALALTDEVLAEDRGGQNLTEGWGGIQFHVIDLK